MEHLVVVFAVVCLITLSIGAWFAAKVVSLRKQRKREWDSLDSAGVERGLHILLKRGYDGAFAILTAEDTDAFVQFRKYVLRPGSFGIEMHFPRAPWSEPYYARVQELLRRRRLEFERIPVNTPPTVEFLQVDFSDQVTVATEVVSEIMMDVFGLSEMRVRFRADDICPIDATVDRKDYPRVRSCSCPDVLSSPGTELDLLVKSPFVPRY